MPSHHAEDSAQHSEMLFVFLFHKFYYIDSMLPIQSSYIAQLQKKYNGDNIKGYQLL